MNKKVNFISNNIQKFKENIKTPKYILGIVGAILMAFGVFLPLYSINVLGLSVTVNYISNGGRIADGIFIIIFAVAVLLTYFINKPKFAILPAGISIYMLVNLFIKMDGTGTELGIRVGSFQIGYYLMIIGTVMVVAGAILDIVPLKKKTSSNDVNNNNTVNGNNYNYATNNPNINAQPVFNNNFMNNSYPSGNNQMISNNNNLTNSTDMNNQYTLNNNFTGNINQDVNNSVNNNDIYPSNNNQGFNPNNNTLNNNFSSGMPNMNEQSTFNNSLTDNNNSNNFNN